MILNSERKQTFASQANEFVVRDTFINFDDSYQGKRNIANRMPIDICRKGTGTKMPDK